jgi:small subunit ribosomal protein S6
MATASELPSLADAPGTAREYETIFILRPGTTNDGVSEVNERVRGIIESMSGKVLKVDNWGKRRLAYEIQKERKGIYLYWQYLATRGVVEEIERNLRMLDAVVRYMTVKIDTDIDPEARPSEVDDTTYERAANTAADEEDMYLNRANEEGDEGGEGEGEGEGEGNENDEVSDAGSEGSDKKDDTDQAKDEE